MALATFKEFLLLTERYYEPDEKLPSGNATPLSKALAKQKKRKSIIGPHTNLARMRKHERAIETKVRHGADNPNYNNRVYWKDHDEIDVESDGKSYLTVNHKPSKVSYRVIKGPEGVHSIEWDHNRGKRKDLSPSERNSVARDAKRVWDTHVSPRLPYGSNIHNKPAKKGLERVYKRSGFGDVDSSNDQFAKVGREKSPKQKLKGNKSRLTPVDVKQIKKDVNWNKYN